MRVDERSKEQEIVSGFIEIKLLKEDNFLKIRETLSRIGIASKKDNTLFQTCHILFKKGKYYIVHFKELFLLDGCESDIDAADYSRRNTIALLLESWGLLEIVSSRDIEDNIISVNSIKIIPFKEKSNWKLVAKYTLGTPKKIK